MKHKKTKQTWLIPEQHKEEACICNWIFSINSVGLERKTKTNKWNQYYIRNIIFSKNYPVQKPTLNPADNTFENESNRKTLPFLSSWYNEGKGFSSNCKK